MNTGPVEDPTDFAAKCWAKPVTSPSDLLLRAVIALEWNCPGEAGNLSDVDMPPPEVIIDALTRSQCMGDMALGHLVRGVMEYCNRRSVQP